MRVLMLAGLLAAACSGAGQPASAETMQFRAALSAHSEFPPHPDLKGSGLVTGTYDTGSRKLSYKATYEDLTGPATAAHFHGPAPEGQNAGVMVPVNGGLSSPIEGSATLTPDQAKALEDGKMYFNVHTAANKAGEIRGQVMPAK